MRPSEEAAIGHLAEPLEGEYFLIVRKGTYEEPGLSVKPPRFDLRPCTLGVVRDLCERFHGYGSAGSNATYAFAIFEHEVPVAAFVWQPPAPGAAKSVCPEAPHGVLALSRMVAVPREHRELRHISKPLRKQMRALIDRTRWPVLITYSDEGQGHRGHVYKCSGWAPTTRRERPTYLDKQGRRVSSYSNGKHDTLVLRRGKNTWIQRWEHWICPRGGAAEWMTRAGWRRVPLPGVTWRSGSPAFTYERRLYVLKRSVA